MSKVIDYEGKKLMIDCIGCAREKGAFNTGNIYKSEYFDVHQDLETPIPGFLIISSRRHIKSIDEFTDSEQLDFIKTITLARKAQRQILSIEHIIMVQEEISKHHFHVWLFPQYDWMDNIGGRVSAISTIMNYAKESMKTIEILESIEIMNHKLISFFESYAR
jgi:diadenosine tetraphosphate (Ap4A) HIT family hydrolase